MTDPKASRQSRLLIQQLRQQGRSFKAAELEAQEYLPHNYNDMGEAWDRLVEWQDLCQAG